MSDRLSVIEYVIKHTLSEDGIRAVALVLITGATVYMYVIGRDVPGELLALNGTVIGYYFGRGVTNGKNAVNELKRLITH